MTCVVEFAFVVESQTSDEGEETIVEGTLRLLMESAQRLTKLEQASTVALPSPSQYSAEIPVEDQFHLKWFPVLSGLSRIILNASQPSIRSKAADQFFDILRVHGRQFSFGAGHWKSILRSVVLPLVCQTHREWAIIATYVHSPSSKISRIRRGGMPLTRTRRSMLQPVPCIIT